MVVRAFQAESHVSEGAEVGEWREQGWDEREGRGQASEGLMCRGGSFVPWRSFLSHLCAHRVTVAGSLATRVCKDSFRSQRARAQCQLCFPLLRDLSYSLSLWTHLPRR